jgi:phosphomevalonate kinase
VLWAELVASNAQVERSLASLRALTLCSGSGSGDAADAKAMALSAMLIDMSAEACSSEWSAVAARTAADETLAVKEEGASRTLTLAVRFLLDARAALQRSRLLLRRMGERADVPIEPPAQRELCDYTETLPGVVGAGVPGAGGFDAIFAIVVGDGAAAAVRTAWAARGVSALAAADERTLRSGMQLEAFKEGLGK